MTSTPQGVAMTRTLRRFATAGALVVMAAGTLIGTASAAPGVTRSGGSSQSAGAMADACPGGWATETTGWFGPPRIDTGIPNPPGDDGCPLPVAVRQKEPFAGHGRFVSTVARATREFHKLGLLDAR